jgi:hypothetical protein
MTTFCFGVYIVNYSMPNWIAALFSLIFICLADWEASGARTDVYCGAALHRTPVHRRRSLRYGRLCLRQRDKDQGMSSLKFFIAIFRVADPGCLSRILDSNFLIPDPGSSVKKIPDPQPHQRSKVFITQKIVSKLSEIWSGMFIPDPDLDFLPIPDPGVKKAPDPDSQPWLSLLISRC